MIHIVMPAWGTRCIDCATWYTIPSIMAALEYANKQASFFVYTDNAEAFDGAFGKHNVTLQNVPNAATAHKALTAAHIAVIQAAQEGTSVALLNADLIISKEAFVFASEKFNQGFKAIVSSGVRTLAGEAPPIGVSAKELLSWGWANRHPVTESCVWGRGRTTFPVSLYFEEGDNVVLRSSHLHPFIICKDRRSLPFRGTVDDDLLAAYSDGEIFYLHNAEVGIIEISPQNGLGPHFEERGDVIFDPRYVGKFAQHFMPAHLRNFKHPLQILGDGPAGEAAAAKIADMMLRHHQGRDGR